MGAITVVAGISGSVAGALCAQRLEPRFGSPALLAVPAAFTLPGAGLLAFALAAGGGSAGALARVDGYARLFAAEWCLWTHLAPVAAVSTNAVPPRLRAQAAALGNLMSHLLGDMVSPPLIGGISDATGSLRAGLQVTWAAVLVSGLVWGAGAVLLPPLPDLRRSKSRLDGGDGGGGNAVSNLSTGDVIDDSPPTTFWALLCGPEPDEGSGSSGGNSQGPQAGTALLEATTDNPLVGREDAPLDEAGGDLSVGEVLNGSGGNVRDSRAGRLLTRDMISEIPQRPRRRQS